MRQDCLVNTSTLVKQELASLTCQTEPESQYINPTQPI